MTRLDVGYGAADEEGGMQYDEAARTQSGAHARRSRRKLIVSAAAGSLVVLAATVLVTLSLSGGHADGGDAWPTELEDPVEAADFGHPGHPVTITTTTTIQTPPPAWNPSLSGLRPMVVPDPDTYYNVFDPAVRNKTSHLRWTPTRLRHEVLKLIKLIAIVDEKEEKDHTSQMNGLEGMDERVLGALEELSAEAHDINNTMSSIANRTTAATNGLSDAVGSILSRMDGLKNRVKGQMKGFWGEAEQQSTDNDQNVFLRRSKIEQLQAEMPSAMMGWKEMAERLRSDVKRGDEALEQELSNVRFRMQANMSVLISTLSDLASELKDRQLQQSSEVHELGLNFKPIEEDVARETTGWSVISMALPQMDARANEQLQEIGKVEEQLGALADRVEDLGGRGREQHNETKEAAAMIQENIDILDSRLESLSESVSSMCNLLEDMRGKDRAEARKEQADVYRTNTEIGSVTPQVVGVAGNKQALVTLQMTLEKEIEVVQTDAEATKMHVRELLRKTSDAAESITSLNARLVKVGNDQEALTQDDETKFSDEMTIMQPLFAELLIVKGYVEEFSALRERAGYIIKNITGFVQRIDTQQKEWKEDALKRILELEGKLMAHKGRENQDMHELRREIGDLAGAVGSMKSFKDDTVSLELQLKAQINDTTQALGILDAKFSSQEADLTKKFNDIEKGMAVAADPDTVKRGLDGTQIKYEAVSNDIADVGRQLGELELQQQKRAMDLTAQMKGLMTADRWMNVSVTALQNHLVQHPPIFDKIDYDLAHTPPTPTTPPPVAPSLAKLPPPLTVKWWGHRTNEDNLQDPSGEAPLSAEMRLDRQKEGFIEGRIPLPLWGKWMVQFYVSGPKYDKGVGPDATFPLESVDKPDPTDAIVIDINGQREVYNNALANQGQKDVIVKVFEADFLYFKFTFTSKNVMRRLHPFVSPGEITLLSDRNPAPKPTAPSGSFEGTVVDATTGKKIARGYGVKDGTYVYKADEDVSLAVYLGSTLLTTIATALGSYKVDLPAGTYTCQATLSHFYAYYDDECIVTAGGKLKKTITLSPLLNPGSIRVVLQWGENPRDLDSYLTVPKLPTDRPRDPLCEVNYRNRECMSGLARLDVDQTQGLGPETITVDGYRPGTYYYRVNAYGMDAIAVKNENLQKSLAMVTFYTEEFTRIFEIHKDGFIDGGSWYVFSIDGNTRKWAPCTRSTCPSNGSGGIVQ